MATVYRVRAFRDGDQLRPSTNGQICQTLEDLQSLLENYAAAYDMDVDTDELAIRITREER